MSNEKGAEMNMILAITGPCEKTNYAKLLLMPKVP